MEVKPEIETFAQIRVIGVGGSGGSAITRMIENGLKGVDFVAVNTDAQALHHNPAKKKIHIGKTTTRGLGAGMDPEVGYKAAEENADDIGEILKGADMVFITCGLGGGTGSGAAPYVAQAARDAGALTVAVVTKPFEFEGAQRAQIAEAALNELADKVDTIITIPNDRLLQIIDKKTSLVDAFNVVDEVLRQGVQGISDLITVPGLINVDFADVKSVMKDAGSALMGIGKASGENRAIDAAKAAIDSPLLEMSIDGAKGILFTVTGGANLGMFELNEAARVITENADPNARIIFGSVIDESMGDEVQVTVVATGFGDGPRSSKKVEATNPFRDMDALKSGMQRPASSSDDDDRAPAAPKSNSIMNQDPVDNTQDDDLDIPAFIRKKMM
ncbi:MAG: cell division protein FtsZ [Candidatus Kerfeldbacteria bacterium CG15_BIG_FIL_POST_REV_8_21_14_020_45_12]|uniref:Cell division protein FtsZ n=1 Tax=Candidatus Kerfeldbacteria bacterium CG15_BIG_FIL_POST_REV_8_21_14_020_45_12 TaxID=2014247 RepID=A0A2M7H3M1_9BACT|nr:MAG: cell division protein FtsZ [Candidatus Kerfeldbacteria bacterium CG15_BIG_FIL_POST_REV_8_21_14_020_45_12]PJA93447.1 MAG: cell division protein FtsZ [Candidatus Kerfeldbacteria bacterium CG_4_9_14_3_um_filter_45_8]